MANRHKGEVTIDVEGTAYTLALTIDAMVALEDQFSTPQKLVTFQEILGLADRGSVKAMRALIWAALQRHHPTITLTDVSDLVQRAGGLAAFVQTFSALAKVSFADPKDLEALGVPTGANPPRAQGGTPIRGTGGRSTSTPAVSA